MQNRYMRDINRLILGGLVIAATTLTMAHTGDVKHKMHADDIEKSMKQMKRAYTDMTHAETIADLSKMAAVLREKTNAAANIVYKGTAAEQEIYKRGMAALNDDLNALDAAIKANDLVKAKAVIAKINETRKVFHKEIDA